MMIFASLKWGLGGVALAMFFLPLTGCMLQWTQHPVENRFHSSLEGTIRYGPVNGFVQTPTGGRPGTSSHNRPTFNELNINDSASAEASLEFGWREHGIYMGGNYVRLDGRAELDKPLVSHGSEFSAGDQVRSEIQLDWYKVGYEYRFLFRNNNGTLISISPSIGAALLNFDYNLQIPGGPLAKRAYKVGTPQFGLKAEWIPKGRFSVAAGVLSSIPEASDLFILSTQLTGQYQLWGRPEHGGIAFLGVGYDLLEFQDHQRLSNHVQANLGPMLLFGIKTEF